MTSLLRFLFNLILLAGLGYGVLVALAVFVEPEKREVTVTVPPSRFEK